jgi:hypothetical protein
MSEKEKIALLPGEHIVLRSNFDNLVLTNYRLRYDVEKFGGSVFIGITLNSLSSCGLVTKSSPVLLLLAGLSLLASFVAKDNGSVAVGIAVVLAVAYFLTRRSVISLAPNGGQPIVVPTSGMSRNDIVNFLEAVEREKLARLA